MTISNDLITNLSVLAALSGFVSVLVCILFGYLVTGAPPLPSSRQAAQTMVALLPPTINGEIHELGCAWGGLAITLAKRYPTNHIIAWELSPIPYCVARMRSMWSPLENVSVRFGDALKADLSHSGAVTCYLTPPVMEKLAPKLMKELPDGVVIVSNTFGLRGWQPEKSHTLSDLYNTPVYRYRKVPPQNLKRHDVNG